MTVRVMVVDDTDHVRDMLVQMLELDGFDVVGEAESGPQAVDIALKAEPNIVIMDYKMPKMNGLDAASKIRENRPTQAIILYSAYLDSNVETRAKEVGVASCVGKAEGINHLERQIRRLSSSLDWHKNAQ